MHIDWYGLFDTSSSNQLSQHICRTLENLLRTFFAFVVPYSSFVAVYCMKWLKNIQIIRIIRIIFRYSNIRIMIFKLWILFIIRFGHFLPTNIIRLFDSLQNDYSWQHWEQQNNSPAILSNIFSWNINYYVVMSFQHFKDSVDILKLFHLTFNVENLHKIRIK